MICNHFLDDISFESTVVIHWTIFYSNPCLFGPILLNGLRYSRQQTCALPVCSLTHASESKSPVEGCLSFNIETKLRILGMLITIL